METVQIDFNPEEISYRQLLDLFWENHSPEYNMASRQYMSAIHCSDERQQEEALKSFREQEIKLGTKLFTEIILLGKFYIAEAYHQKYYLQQVSMLKEELKRSYPDFKGFVDSTAAARVNGYLKGVGSMEQLMQEIDGLGLSDKAKKRLIEIVDSYEA